MGATRPWWQTVALILAAGARSSAGAPGPAERGSAGCDKVRRVGVQLPAATLLAHHHVLDPCSDPAWPDDGRLVRERCAGFEQRVVLLGDERPLVHVEADAVTHPMPKIGPVAGLLDGCPAGAVDLGAGHARPGGRAAGFLCRQHRCVSANVLRSRLPAEDRASEIRAVAIEDGTEVEQHSLAVSKRPARARAA